MNIGQKAFKYIFETFDGLCRAFLVIQVISCTIVVVGRYAFLYTPKWCEELTLFCLVWMASLGGALALRKNDHLAITIIEKIIPKKFHWILMLVIDVFILLFSYYIFKVGLSVVEVGHKSSFYGIGLKKSFQYAALPFSMIILIISVIERYYNTLADYLSKRKERSNVN